jgi:uncharacterized protein (DUF427 family)
MVSWIPKWAQKARIGWKYSGRTRPSFALQPSAGQESAWDYPRPPVIQEDAREVVLKVGDIEIGRSKHALRVLETASPPTFYLPVADLKLEHFKPAPGHSLCEWKGQADYFDVVVASETLERAAWSYPDPLPGMERLKGMLSVYPSRVLCTVDGVRVKAQPGRFYGGWVTPEVVGPFKGEPGSENW